MPTLTLDRRTFTGNADCELDHPVDGLGRVRWRATLDRRSIQRRDGDSDPIGFRGHAAVFDTPTWIGSRSWGFWEQISPGAFAKTIQEADVRFLINHDPNLLLARNKASTLRLSEDGIGLDCDADMAPVTYARDLAVSLERGDISQMSFAFEPVAWKREEHTDGETIYTLTEVRLWDVSVVTYPAYEETDASLRSAAFGALAHELGADPSTLLRHFADGHPLGEFLDRDTSRHGTGDTSTSEPPEGTRSDDQPEQTTGPTPIDQLRLRTIQARHAEHERKAG